MNYYLFIGFFISEESANDLFMHDKYPSVQTHKFIDKFVRSIELDDSIKCEYISALPSSVYPKNKSIRFPKKKYAVKLSEKNVLVTEMSFCNLPFFRLISRFFNAFFLSLSVMRKNKKEAIIVYSVHVPFLLTGVIISKLFKINLICLWTDPPSVFNSKNIFIKVFRKIEFKISKYLMKKADKIIALTEFLATDFAPNKPFLVVEGIIDDKDSWIESKGEGSLNELVKIVYTGSVNIKYGVDKLVESVISMNNEYNLSLEIYGVGDYSDKLKDISDKTKSVNYHGFVDYKEIPKIQAQADFLINTRQNDDYIAKYSFPSKILEYMISGTPVITTYLTGMPAEYKELMIIIEDNDVSSIKSKLIEAINLPLNKRREIAIKARDFALTKTIANQSKRIVNFIKYD